MKTPKPGDGCDCGCGTSQDFALAKSRRSKHRFVFIVAVGAVVVLVVWLFREPLRQLITREATLANDAPTQEAVGDMIEHATDQRAALLAAWNSGKIVHREVAIQSFAQVFPPEEPLPPEFDSLILSAALDPDMNVREMALTILQRRKHPALAELYTAS